MIDHHILSPKKKWIQFIKNQSTDFFIQKYTKDCFFLVKLGKQFGIATIFFLKYLNVAFKAFKRIFLRDGQKVEIFFVSIILIKGEIEPNQTIKA
jgi:hypothetical protein